MPHTKHSHVALMGLATLTVGLVVVLLLFERRPDDAAKGDAARSEVAKDDVPRGGASLTTSPSNLPAREEQKPSATARAEIEGEEASPPSAPTSQANLDFVAEDLYGVVLARATQAPLPDADVMVFPPDTVSQQSDLRPLRTTKTATDGTFRLPDEGAFQRSRLIVSLEGFATESAWALTGSPQHIELEPALHVSGRAVWADDESPIKGVVLREQGERWDGDALRPIESVSDELGEFHLEGLAAGDTFLEIYLPGGERTSRPMALDESVEDLQLVFPRPEHPVLLRLVEVETGQPLANVQVRWNDAISASTDADGIVQLAFERVLFGSLEVAGFCPTNINIRDDPGPAPVAVPFTRGSRLEGRVVDAEGRAVANARVALYAKAWRLGADGRFLPNSLIGTLGDEIRWSHSDEDGRFAFDRVPVLPQRDAAPRHHLRAEQDGVGFAARSFLAAPPGETYTIALTLNPRAALQGTVTLGDAPASEAYVHASCEATGDYSGLHVNEVGGFRLLLSDGGLYTVEALLGSSSASKTVEVGVGEQVRVDLELPDNPDPSVQGVVADENGNPVRGALVYVAGKSPAIRTDGAMLRTAGGPTSRSAADGTFELAVEPASSSLTIAAFHHGVEARASTQPGATDVHLILPAPAWLRLRPISSSEDARSGMPTILAVPAGRGLEDPGVRYHLLSSPDAHGIHAIGVPPGVWSVWIYRHGFAPARLDGLVAAERDGPVHTVPLRRGVLLTIHLEGDGEPNWDMAHAWTAEDPRSTVGANLLGRRMRGQPMRLKQAHKGSPPWAHRVPGRYELTDLPKGWRFEPMAFDVPNVEQHEVTIRFWRE